MNLFKLNERPIMTIAFGVCVYKHVVYTGVVHFFSPTRQKAVLGHKL